MDNNMRTIGYILAVFLLFTSAVMSEKQKNTRIVEKLEELSKQYRELNARVLAPAGVSREFNRFVAKNPGYLQSSYKRSKTADVIRELLKGRPRYLDMFEKCGLSRGGEYFCRRKDCPIHGARTSGKGIVLEGVTGLAYISAAVGGLLLFVALTGSANALFNRLGWNTEDDTSAEREEE